jgi:hypothetical protein
MTGCRWIRIMCPSGATCLPVLTSLSRFYGSSFAVQKILVLGTIHRKTYVLWNVNVINGYFSIQNNSLSSITDNNFTGHSRCIIWKKNCLPVTSTWVCFGSVLTQLHYKLDAMISFSNWLVKYVFLGWLS